MKQLRDLADVCGGLALLMLILFGGVGIWSVAYRIESKPLNADAVWLALSFVLFGLVGLIAIGTARAFEEAIK